MSLRRAEMCSERKLSLIESRLLRELGKCCQSVCTLHENQTLGLGFLSAPSIKTVSYGLPDAACQRLI